MSFGNLTGLMQKVNKLQKSLQELEKNFANKPFEGLAGGNLVKVTITGDLSISNIEIDDSLLQVSEKSVLSDLIAAAYNNAKNKANETKKAEMEGLTGGLPIPPGLGL